MAPLLPWVAYTCQVTTSQHSSAPANHSDYYVCPREQLVPWVGLHLECWAWFVCCLHASWHCTLQGRSQPNLRSHALQLQSGRGQCIILAFGKWYTLEGTGLNGICIAMQHDCCPSIENAFDLNMWKEAIHRAKVEYVVKKKVSQVCSLVMK